MKIFDEIETMKKNVLRYIDEKKIELRQKMNALLDEYEGLARTGWISDAQQDAFLKQVNRLSLYVPDRNLRPYRAAIDQFEGFVRNLSLYRDQEKEYFARADVRRWKTTSCPTVSVCLPLEPEELSEILQANELESCVVRSVESDICDFREYGYELIAGSIQENNYFLYLLSEMDEQQREVFGIAYHMYSPRSMKDMINLAANIDGFLFYDVKSMKELGEYLLKNDLFAYTIEDHILPFLNYEKIAEWHIKSHHCMLLGGYIENTRQPEEMIEVYDGITIPDFSISEKQEQTADQAMNL